MPPRRGAGEAARRWAARAVATSIGSLPSLLVEDRRALGDRRSVVAGLRGPEVDPIGAREDGLAPAEVVVARRDDGEEVAAAQELGPRRLRDEGLDLEV